MELQSGVKPITDPFEIARNAANEYEKSIRKASDAALEAILDKDGRTDSLPEFYLGMLMVDASWSSTPLLSNTQATVIDWLKEHVDRFDTKQATPVAQQVIGFSVPHILETIDYRSSQGHPFEYTLMNAKDVTKTEDVRLGNILLSVANVVTWPNDYKNDSYEQEESSFEIAQIGRIKHLDYSRRNRLTDQRGLLTLLGFDEMTSNIEDGHHALAFERLAKLKT